VSNGYVSLTPAIAVFDADEKKESVFVQLFRGYDYDLRFFRRPLDLRTARSIDDVEGIAMFLRPKITSKLLHELPRLKVISIMSSGFDNVDLDACKSRNVSVCNAPDFCINSVAGY